LSDVDGEAALCLPDYFAANSGSAFLAGPQGSGLEPRVRVATRRLDSVVSAPTCPAVMKIDVEGHEAQVLAGAGELLARRCIRDIVLEEHSAYPSRSTTLLEQHGYSVYRLRRTFLRPVIEPPDLPHTRSSWEAPNYLATTDPDRARSRLHTIGWQCLS
jgi:hypothetical protein